MGLPGQDTSNTDARIKTSLKDGHLISTLRFLRLVLPERGVGEPRMQLI